MGGSKSEVLFYYFTAFSTTSEPRPGPKAPNCCCESAGNRRRQTGLLHGRLQFEPNTEPTRPSPDRHPRRQLHALPGQNQRKLAHLQRLQIHLGAPANASRIDYIFITPKDTKPPHGASSTAATTRNTLRPFPGRDRMVAGRIDRKQVKRPASLPAGGEAFPCRRKRQRP